MRQRERCEMSDEKEPADESVAAGLKQAFRAELDAAEADLDKLGGLQGVLASLMGEVEGAIKAATPPAAKTAAA